MPLDERARQASAPDLCRALADWQARTLEPSLKRQPERPDCGEVPRLATPLDVPQLDYLRDLGFPGEYPFTRGVQPTMYRGRFWTMRQYAGFGQAEESNRRYKFLLEQGQTGLSVAFDLPTQMGYDADHPVAAPEVGKVGVSISSLEDMETLLDGIPLERVSVSMTINATAGILLAMVIAVAERQGVPLDRLNGTIQNDILKEYAARGTYIYPPEPSMRLITDIFAYCAEQVPNWNTISISGYHMREAGCTAAQEIGFTLANGVEYVRRAVAAGLDVDDFAPRLSFFFNSHMNFFEEVAKFRAARRLWARIMRERFRARNPRSWMMRFHTQTAGSTLTAQQVDNNVVRTTLQALAAVLGGTQSLHTNARDEALALPSEEAARLALRTQQIIAYESGAADTIDPLAGSYFVEHLTSRLEAEASAYIERIDALGGATAAIEQGYVQREIEDAAYEAQRRIELGQRIVVGLNRFQSDEPPHAGLLQVDPEVARRQAERLASLRRRRDQAAVEGALRALAQAAREGENLMARIVPAVRAYATLGEIADVLRDVFGVYRPSASWR